MGGPTVGTRNSRINSRHYRHPDSKFGFGGFCGRKFVLASRENSSVRQPAVIDRLHFEGCRETDGPNFGQRSEFGFLLPILGILVVPGSEILEGLDSSCALNSIRRTGKMQPAQTQESKVSRFGVRTFQLGCWLFWMFQEENRSFTA